MPQENGVVQDIVDKVFEADEMAMNKADLNWKPGQLLRTEGVFYLKDVVKILNINDVELRRMVREIGPVRARDEIGIITQFRLWRVRMKIFSEYYRQALRPPLRVVDPDWDLNTLLKEDGSFRLQEVGQLLPLDPAQWEAWKRREDR